MEREKRLVYFSSEGNGVLLNHPSYAVTGLFNGREEGDGTESREGVKSLKGMK
jgi:hypothetical protein